MQGVTFVNQYIIMRTLGSGSFGKVKLCMNSQDQQLYAVKVINRQAMLRNSRLNRRPGSQMASPGEHVMKEIAVMRNLRHQNIVHLKEIIGELEFFRLGHSCPQNIQFGPFLLFMEPGWCTACCLRRAGLP